MATDDGFWAKFRRWRRQRPFWGGLILVVSAVVFFVSSNMALGGIEVHLGPTGFLSYLIPLLLLLSGVLSWVTPAQRLFYGIIALATALYSLIGLNLGGFFIGMLLGFFGGALVIAWGPPRSRPASEQPSPPTGDSGDDAAPGPDEPPTEQFEIAGHDDHPTADLRPGIIPGMEPEEPPRRAHHPVPKNKALAAGMLVLGLAASVLVAGGSLPARADVECPDGQPSGSSSPPSASATSSPPSQVPSSASQPSAAASPAGASASVSPSPTATEDGDKSIVDGLHDIVGGVGNLLGINGDESTSPSLSPSTSPTPSPDPTASPAPADPTDPSAPSTSPPKSAPTADPTSAPASASAPEPDPSDSELPCLGPRLYGKVADRSGLPITADKPGLLEDDKLTLIGASYEGVADLPTGTKGTVKALQFNMKTAINDGFTLSIDEPGGGQTIIRSDRLTTDKNVRFYTPKFQGKFLGLIPMTFTPEQPPPLMLDWMVFTDVKINLAYVRCDVLTAKPAMTITEKP